MLLFFDIIYLSKGDFMRKKYVRNLLLMVTIFCFSPLLVKAENLECEYHYYYNGNGLNQGDAAADFYANCTFTFNSKNEISKHSCKMNYYVKGKEKTKKKTLDNFNTKNFGKDYSYFYTSDGKSVKEMVEKTKTCPSYTVGFYQIKTGAFNSNQSNILIYGAETQQRAKEITQELISSLKNTQVFMLKNTAIGATDDEQKKAYQEIEEAIASIEKTLTETSFDFRTCSDPDDVITKYSKCETLINNMETALNTIEKKLNGYIMNNIVDKNDERVKKLQKLIDQYKKYIRAIKQNMDALDCETKKQLGLVKSCESTPTDVVNPSDTFEYESSEKKCVSCGDGALKDIPMQLPMFVRNLIFALQLLVPILLIALGVYDFIRAVISSDEKAMKESQGRFMRRIIAGVVIFFVIALVKFVFGMIPGNVNTLGCVPCFISDGDSCGEPYDCDYAQQE